MSSLLRLECQQKDFFKTISNFPHYFFSYSYGIEMTITLIHSHSSLENHTPFQTKLGKIYTLFQAETVQLKILPFGAAHTYVAYIRKYPLVCMTALFSNFPPTGKKIFLLRTRQNQFQPMAHISSSNAPEPPLPDSYLTRSHNINSPV